jgi:hypothetical protein
MSGREVTVTRPHLFLLLLAACSPEQELPTPVDQDQDCSDTEVPYDGIDNDCDPRTADDDLDEDGHRSVDDCDDQDAVRGGAEAPSDGIDNDCDDAIDCEDSDLIGFASAWEGDLTAEDLPGFCDVYCSRTIRGALVLEDTDLVDLTPLSCLTAVWGRVTLRDNPELTSLDGLQGLREIGGDLSLWDNPALEDVTALYELELVGGDVSIRGNRSLTNAAAQALADEIDQISGSLFIEGNE